MPNDMSPYSIFGEFINSIHNPYGGGCSISGGTATLENETIGWMGSLIGYDGEKLGGQFVSGGSMVNLTASIVARDDKLKPEEFIKGTVYVSDQTHSSVTKAVHLMGLPKKNVRIVPTIEDFKMDINKLEEIIKDDILNDFKPFLLVGSSGTTNIGSVDPLGKLGEIAEKYKIWYHVDGAYGASVLLSSHKDMLRELKNQTLLVGMDTNGFFKPMDVE
ncbi:pyridoxal phosphate-dependent decarboxylase family protein [Anaerosalibacter bizertensis]|uniref:pyridoxal phosphate-dependent decarboxylase family protein n=1 Tax=Anaerosalibacter bizertensis TaxID=932217 RepID=UPI003514BC2A